jgi:hypothetical protein
MMLTVEETTDEHSIEMIMPNNLWWGVFWGVEGLCGPKSPEVCRVKRRVAPCPMLNMGFSKKKSQCYLFGFDHKSK